MCIVESLRQTLLGVRPEREHANLHTVRGSWVFDCQLTAIRRWRESPAELGWNDRTLHASCQRQLKQLRTAWAGVTHDQRLSVRHPSDGSRIAQRILDFAYPPF